MILLKSLASAFLMYSRIPMPNVEWKEENRRYSLCFFPAVGAVIGVLFVLCRHLCGLLEFSGIFTGVVLVIIPIIITGGIHLDGFCDVIDAKSSFANKKKRLEIMSDPHIGSFAVIYLILYFLVQTAVLCEIDKTETALVIAIGFVFSRTLSGIGAVCFKSAKSEGALQSFVKPAHKKSTLFVLAIVNVIAAAAMLCSDVIAGGFAALGAISALIYYRLSAYKNFGGITGDTAGWFLQVCELTIAIMALVGEKITEAALL